MRYLYKITNLINGKCYIGQTNNIKTRFSNHINGHPKHKSLIHLAIVKYGKENFKFEVLDEIVDEMIDGEERQAIITYNSLVPVGYNLEEGGACIKKHNEETKKRIGIKQKGYVMTEERKRNISKAKKAANATRIITPEMHERLSKAHTGKQHTKETLNKMSVSGFLRMNTEENKRKVSERNRGKTLSEETRAKISKANKGKIRSDECKEKHRILSTGRKQSLETRAKKSVAIKAALLAKKLLKAEKLI